MSSVACRRRAGWLAGAGLPVVSRAWVEAQPPVQLPCRRALPCRLAPRASATAGSVRSQRWVRAASSSCTSKLPAPSCGAMLPLACACAPGTVRRTWPLVDMSFVCKRSWPCSSAWLARSSSSRRSTTCCCPCCCHWPLAARLSRRRVRADAGALLSLPGWVEGVLSATSNCSAWPLCWAVAWPFSRSGASWVCSAAGDSCCTVACSCQGAGAGLHRPCRRTSPLPTRTVAAGTTQVLPSNWARALTWLAGRRFWSQGPGRLLRMSACRFQSVPVLPGGAAVALPLACAGPADTVPPSRVAGASGHRRARSSAWKSAWACSSGWEAQGAMSACTLACMAGLLVLGVLVSGCTWAWACRRASVPARVPCTWAWAARASGGWGLPGTGVVMRPCRVASRAMGAAPCNCSWAL